MAHKKAGGSSRNGRDSAGKRLGVKLFGGQTVNAGSIIVTQRGTKMIPGANVYAGRQHSLHASVDGRVVFERKAEGRVHVTVQPVAQAAEETTLQGILWNEGPLGALVLFWGHAAPRIGHEIP